MAATPVSPSTTIRRSRVRWKRLVPSASSEELTMRMTPGLRSLVFLAVLVVSTTSAHARSLVKHLIPSSEPRGFRSRRRSGTPPISAARARAHWARWSASLPATLPTSRPFRPPRASPTASIPSSTSTSERRVVWRRLRRRAADHRQRPLRHRRSYLYVDPRSSMAKRWTGSRSIRNTKTHRPLVSSLTRPSKAKRSI